MDSFNHLLIVCRYLVLCTLPQGSRVDAGKADVVLRSSLFIYTHALPMLPGETLVTLPEERGGREGSGGNGVSEWRDGESGGRE